MLGMAPAAPPAGLGEGGVGHAQRRLRQRVADRGLPRRAKRLGIWGGAGRDHRVVNAVALEHLAGIGPEPVERVLHPGAALVGAVAQGDDDAARPVEVISCLLHRLRGDPSHARVGRRGERGQHRMMPTRRRGTTASSCARSRDWAARPAAGCGSPSHRAASPRASASRPAPSTLARQPQPELRLPHQVERGVRQRDVLLQRGAAAASIPTGAAPGSGQRCRPGRRRNVERRGPVTSHRPRTRRGCRRRTGGGRTLSRDGLVERVPSPSDPTPRCGATRPPRCSRPSLRRV